MFAVSFSELINYSFLFFFYRRHHRHYFFFSDYLFLFPFVIAIRLLHVCASSGEGMYACWRQLMDRVVCQLSIWRADDHEPGR